MYLVFNQTDKDSFKITTSNFEIIKPVDLQNGLSFIKKSDYLANKELFSVDNITFKIREILDTEWIKDEE